jgi:hypothetical protein
LEELNLYNIRYPSMERDQDFTLHNLKEKKKKEEENNSGRVGSSWF